MKFYNQSLELLCNVPIGLATQVGDILRFVDFLIKCNFSLELYIYANLTIVNDSELKGLATL